MKIKSSLFIFLLLTVGCSDDKESSGCFSGTSLGYICCNGVSLIQVHSIVPIGKSYKSGEKTFYNVIQVPLNIEAETNIYFKVGPKNIDELAPTCECLMSVPLNVPLITFSAYSTSGCP